MFSRFIIGLPLTAVFAFATVSAQSRVTTGAIRCESCALTRQKPEPFDPAKNDVVPRVDGELPVVPQKTPEPPVIAVIQLCATSASRPVCGHGR